jgi:hypothetical protein
MMWFSGRLDQYEESVLGQCMGNWEIDIKSAVQEELLATYLSHLIMLIEKNNRYGNSALEPLGVFHQEGSADGLLVRIDDKLQRIKNGAEIRKNDVADLVGYLMLYMVKRGWTNFEEMID